MTQQEFFNRYTYNVKTDRIGGGGFGTVYRATDNVLHRKVAIKVSEVKFIGSKEFSLKTEFDAISNLPAHPNIAHYEKLYSFEAPQGVFDYAIMQYYKDGSLKQLIENQNISLTYNQKDKIAQGILDGIAFLHKNKVVHRDLKPANILICKEDDDYIPLLTDFGLSKCIEEISKSGFTNSIAGGSPGYMSPEQILGKQMQLNTDLWSYGVIVYELFSGERLFKSASEGSTSEVNDMILHKDVSNEIASLPEKWRGIVERCLVRDNRYRAKGAEELGAKSNKHENRYYDYDAGKGEKHQFSNAHRKIENDDTYNDDNNYVKKNKSDGFRDVIESNIANGNYREAYDLCLQLVHEGKKDQWVQNKIDEIIPLMTKVRKKEDRKNILWAVVLTIIAIIVLVICS